jgi:predicted transcriptional regulator
MFYGVLEVGIMKVIWDLQEQNEDANISVADIVIALNNNKVERAYTTVKTVMDRLVAKGVLVRYMNNKKFFYKSTVDRIEATKDAIDTVSDYFFAGNYVHMVRFIEKECENFLTL